MEIEIVGRHALLFDDDGMANFVNSRDALVEWNNLPIDRYDVRHLLSDLPPRKHRHQSSSLVSSEDLQLEAELDLERFADLPSSSCEETAIIWVQGFACLYIIRLIKNCDHYVAEVLVGSHTEVEKDAESTGAGRYQAVPFAYGNTADSADQKSMEMEMKNTCFYPPFPVPERLLQNLMLGAGRSSCDLRLPSWAPCFLLIS